MCADRRRETCRAALNDGKEAGLKRKSVCFHKRSSTVGAEWGMSGRSGAAPRGCNNPILQPLRATVPYKFQRGSALLCREVKTGKYTLGRWGFKPAFTSMWSRAPKFVWCHNIIIISIKHSVTDSQGLQFCFFLI